jgi:hypothetical protein
MTTPAKTFDMAVRMKAIAVKAAAWCTNAPVGPQLEEAVRLYKEVGVMRRLHWKMNGRDHETGIAPHSFVGMAFVAESQLLAATMEPNDRTNPAKPSDILGEAFSPAMVPYDVPIQRMTLRQHRQNMAEFATALVRMPWNDAFREYAKHMWRRAAMLCSFFYADSVMDDPKYAAPRVTRLRHKTVTREVTETTVSGGENVAVSVRMDATAAGVPHGRTTQNTRTVTEQRVVKARLFGVKSLWVDDMGIIKCEIERAFGWIKAIDRLRQQPLPADIDGDVVRVSAWIERQSPTITGEDFEAEFADDLRDAHVRLGDYAFYRRANGGSPDGAALLETFQPDVAAKVSAESITRLQEHLKKPQSMVRDIAFLNGVAYKMDGLDRDKGWMASFRRDRDEIVVFSTRSPVPGFHVPLIFRDTCQFHVAMDGAVWRCPSVEHAVAMWLRLVRDECDGRPANRVDMSAVILDSIGFPARVRQAREFTAAAAELGHQAFTDPHAARAYINQMRQRERELGIDGIASDEESDEEVEEKVPDGDDAMLLHDTAHFGTKIYVPPKS